MIEDQVIPLGAPHRQLMLEVHDPRHAQIDVVKLELLHRGEHYSCRVER